MLLEVGVTEDNVALMIESGEFASLLAFDEAGYSLTGARDNEGNLLFTDGADSAVDTENPSTLTYSEAATKYYEQVDAAISESMGELGYRPTGARDGDGNLLFVVADSAFDTENPSTLTYSEAITLYYEQVDAAISESMGELGYRPTGARDGDGNLLFVVADSAFDTENPSTLTYSEAITKYYEQVDAAISESMGELGYRPTGARDGDGNLLFVVAESAF